MEKQILNSTLEDINIIFDLYEQARIKFGFCHSAGNFCTALMQTATHKFPTE